MVTCIEAIILGIIQGITEWLPISSSGHLVLINELFGWNPSLLFVVLLHFGTVLVIILFFRQTILEVLKALLKKDITSKEGRLGIYIFIGSIPTAIMGIVFHDFFESLFKQLLAVGVAFLVTGTLLFASKRKGGNRILIYLNSLVIGIAQGFAIIPGISRSGATISTGILLEIDRSDVFTFSFLLSIPAVLGATFMELIDPDLFVSQNDYFPLIVGVLTSMFVGYLSLRILREMVMKRNFYWFSLYCWAVGIIVIIFQLG